MAEPTTDDPHQEHQPISIPSQVVTALIEFPKQMSALQLSLTETRAEVRGISDKFSTFIGLMEKMEFGVKDELKDHEGRLRELEKRSQAGGERTRITDGLMRFMGAPLAVAGVLALVGAYIVTLRQPQAPAPQFIIAPPETLQQIQLQPNNGGAIISSPQHQPITHKR